MIKVKDIIEELEHYNPEYSIILQIGNIGHYISNIETGKFGYRGSKTTTIKIVASQERLEVE